MNKLYEIPIYAFTRKTLQKRVAARTSSFHKQYPAASPRCIDRITYPYRLWEYNHIVGYILISYDFSDICFDLFLPDDKQRYRWHADKKVFLYNSSLCGTHFYIHESMSNEDIQHAIRKMLDDIIRCHIPKRYYVDRESFDRVNPHVDYLNLIKSTI